MEETPFVVEPFDPADAERVSRLFLEVYGDAYPIKTVYEPEMLIAAVAGGHYFPFVVRATPDRIVAYGALYRSAPYGGIYEFGQGVVSSHVRGGGVGRLLFEFVGRYIQTLPGSETYFGEAVCNHTHTQKAGAAIRTIETGMEIDLMPAELYMNDPTVTGRVAVVDMFRSFVPKPHTVYVPGAYEDILRFIYDGFDDRRTVVLSSGAPPSNRRTELSVTVFDFAAVARILVTSVGPDLDRVLAANEESLLKRNVKVIQVWLNTSWSWVGVAAEVLRGRGYFLGGVFPRWFDVDGLLLQKVMGQPNWEGIHLYSERTEKICGAIRDDWDAVGRAPHVKRAE